MILPRELDPVFFVQTTSMHKKGGGLDAFLCKAG
jgi:hypothetical protein